MSTTSEPSESPAVCALPGCDKAVEQISLGQARLYCSVAHRKIARRVRRKEQERLSGRSPARRPVASDTGPPAPAGADEATSRSLPPASARPRSAPSSAPTPKAPRPYLVPAPLPGRFRHSKFIPHAARGVRPARRRDVDLSQLLPRPPQPPLVSQPSPRPQRPAGDRDHRPHPEVPAPRLEATAVVEPTAWLTGVPGGWRGWLRRRRGAARRRQAEAARMRRDAAAVLSGAPLPAETDTDTATNAGADRLGPAGWPGELAARPPGLLARLPEAWSPQMREALVAALQSLVNNRLRSLLTGVGIVLGIAAVIVLVALGNGMKQDFNNRFSKLANQITITPAKGTVPSGTMPRNITDRDVAALQDTQRAPDIAAISPAVLGNLTVTAGQAKDKANLIGAYQNYLEMLDRHLSAGTWFSAQQINRSDRGVVIGQQALNLLWGSDVPPSQVIGEEIRLGHSTFKVQGVLAPDGQEDNAVIVPFDAARAYLVGNNGGKVDMIILKSSSVDNVGQAAAQATAILDKQHDIRIPTDRDFTVRTFTELLKQSADTISFLTMFIIAVAALSLLVGGIGIANIMLVAVTERTREIGIRKAVGATRAAIMRQFMSEAVVLTGTGGIIGIILGVGLTLAAIAVIPTVSSSIPVPIMTASPVIVAFMVSLTIGVLAGSYPAYRAARLQPIQALRFE